MAYTIKIDNFSVEASPAESFGNNITPTKKIGTFGGDLNPIPTSLTDIPASIEVFTLDRERKFLITYGCRFQMNVSMSVSLRLNINGVDISPDIFEGKNNAGGIEHSSGSRTYEATLAAGTHTIKLRSSASTGAASVCAAPFWYGILVEDL